MYVASGPTTFLDVGGGMLGTCKRRCGEGCGIFMGKLHERVAAMLVVAIEIVFCLYGEEERVCRPLPVHGRSWWPRVCGTEHRAVVDGVLRCRHRLESSRDREYAEGLRVYTAIV